MDVFYPILRVNGFYLYNTRKNYKNFTTQFLKVDGSTFRLK